MKPMSKRHHVGIEIEFICSYNKDYVKDAIEDFGLEGNCQLGTDSSIMPIKNEDDNILKLLKLRKELDELNDYWDSRAIKMRSELNELENYLNTHSHEDYDEDDDYYPGDRGYELRVICEQSEVSYVMRQVGKLLKELNAYVNPSCGLHVHLDMRNRKAHKCFLALLKKQPEMQKLVAPYRLESNYCKPAKKYHWLDGERYYAINSDSMTDLKTLEIRLHEGTVSAKKIISWVNYLTNIISGEQYEKKSAIAIRKQSA